MPVALVVRLVFWLWFAGAATIGYFRVLTQLPALVTPALVVVLTILPLAAYFRIAAVRAWVNALALRSLVLLHAARFVGLYFLFLYQRGELPRAFAVPAGIGDIVIATMALPVALAPIDAFARLRAITIWNFVGLVDLVLVLFTAARLFLAEPLLMSPMLRLPLSLVTTLLVPLLLATHIVIFVRLVHERPRPPANSAE